MTASENRPNTLVPRSRAAIVTARGLSRSRSTGRARARYNSSVAFKLLPKPSSSCASSPLGAGRRGERAKSFHLSFLGRCSCTRSLLVSLYRTCTPRVRAGSAKKSCRKPKIKCCCGARDTDACGSVCVARPGPTRAAVECPRLGRQLHLVEECARRTTLDRHLEGVGMQTRGPWHLTPYATTLPSMTNYSSRPWLAEMEYRTCRPTVRRRTLATTRSWIWSSSAQTTEQVTRWRLQVCPWTALAARHRSLNLTDPLLLLATGLLLHQLQRRPCLVEHLQ